MAAQQNTDSMQQGRLSMAATGANLNCLEDRRVVIGKQCLLVSHSSLAHVNLLLQGGDAGLDLVHLWGGQAHQLVALPQASRGGSSGQVSCHHGGPPTQLVHKPDVHLLEKVLCRMVAGQYTQQWHVVGHSSDVRGAELRLNKAVAHYGSSG